MRSFVLIALFTLFILAVDLYTYRGLLQLWPGLKSGHQLFTILFWSLTFAVLVALVWAGTRFQKMRDPILFVRISTVMGIFLMLYVPKLLFNAFQLLGDLSSWTAGALTGSGEPPVLRPWFLYPGAVLGVLLMIGFAMGMIRGKTNVKVFRETIPVSGLPPAFDGLRIVQISDLHLAGWVNDPGYIRDAVDRVNSLDPDLLLFTGDMVHNFAGEMNPFTEILSGLQAPLGKYAILGNHDYGRYYRWESEEAEAANLDQVKAGIRKAGFDLLLNEFRRINLDGQSIELVGVENWGTPPFPREGDLDAALEGTQEGLVKILMSHDPSHWERRVKGRPGIPLTLSGHTHGMQVGFEIGRFRWSPSRWTYRHWAGLYHENGQYHYVNRGLGYTGFPGRVGIRPEITVLTLTAESRP